MECFYYFNFQHNLDPNTKTLPKSMRCSAERLQDNGVYLLGKYIRFTHDTE